MSIILKAPLQLHDVVLIDDGIEGEVVYFDLGEGNRDATSEWCNEKDEGVLIIQENGARIFHDLEYLESEYSRFKVIRRAESNG